MDATWNLVHDKSYDLRLNCENLDLYYYDCQFPNR